MIRNILIGLAILGGLPVLALAVLSLLARRPTNLGVVDGRLADCPATPNCVSSQATRPEQQVPPITFTGAPADAVARLKAILAEMPRARIITVRDDYIHVEFTSALFRFVDDAEFFIDEASRKIHFRSASRSGRSDFGVNRARMEAIRDQVPRVFRD